MARSCGEAGKGLGSEISARCGDRVEKPNSGVFRDFKKKWRELEVGQGFWGSVGAKLIAGVIGVFWTKGKGKNRAKIIRNEGFWGLGVWGEGGEVFSRR